MQASEETDWHARSAEDVASALNTDPDRGLSSEEAQRRLVEIGPNELREMPRPGFLQLLWDQFNNFLVIILVVASVLSFLLGEYLDAGAIMAIVVLNAVLGVVQESKAEEALAALKKMTAPEARIVRDGQILTVPAREVVPGDLVILETGNYVPADLRLVQEFNLRIEEASLTGESVPVDKDADIVLPPHSALGDRRNMAYMSTLVTYGRGRGIAVATGMQTQIGQIAEMIQTYETEPTPLQERLDQLGRWLGTLALAICALIFVEGVVRDTQVGLIASSGFMDWLRLSEAKILEMFMVAVSLAIAAVPEGLPAVVTICLALGMQRMIQRHALLRKLPAVETLGSATVICSDKTGTLTQNEMTVVQVYADFTLLSVTGEGYRPEGEFREDGQPVDVRAYPGVTLMLKAGLLCNDAYLEQDQRGGNPSQWRIVGDPTEGALVVAAAKAGLWKGEMEQDFPRVAEIPFDSARKRMATVHKVGRQVAPTEGRDPAPYVAYVKGAPDVILDLCTRAYVDGKEIPLDTAERERILEVNESLSSNALRVLGVAYRPLYAVPSRPKPEEVEQDLVFVGLMGMIDPARSEVRDAIALARRAGIRTVMVTGDYPNTAAAIARELGLMREGGRVLTGKDLDDLGDEGLREIIGEVDVFARVSPQHKVQLVEALRFYDHVVAMTGDGVNDAPALKRASIGVAMGITGTDVSKETADMILTDDNYASIVAAVEEGRIIYSNIRKFVYYLLSCNVAEILIIFTAMMAGLPLPLTAIQLLVLNLITDGAPALALGLEKGEPDIMEQPPRPTNEPVINRDMAIGIGVQGVAITAATLAAFLLGLRWFPESLAHAQTMAFGTLSISELFRAYTSRSERYAIWAIGPFSNRAMQYAVMSSLTVLLAIIYVPFLDPIFNTTFLGLKEWAVMVPLMLVPSVAAEINKGFLRRAQRRRAEAPDVKNLSSLL
ncbi:MAG: cation-translocating P-type ATPase [Anaerolineae bacterium]